MKIKCFNFKYSKDELKRWTDGDKEFVPVEVLSWIGPGRKRGLGYGEYWVTRYLKDQGYTVINKEYNLSTDNTKYKENNMLIAQIIGEEKYSKLVNVFRSIENEGTYSIAQPNIFAFKDDKYMFVDVKKDQDKIRPPQMKFAKLVKEELEIDYVLCNLQVDIEEGESEVEITT